MLHRTAPYRMSWDEIIVTLNQYCLGYLAVPLPCSPYPLSRPTPTLLLHSQMDKYFQKINNKRKPKPPPAPPANKTKTNQTTSGAYMHVVRGCMEGQ